MLVMTTEQGGSLVEKIRAKNWHELSLKIAQRAKEHSKQYQLDILKADCLSEEEKIKDVKTEKEYRRMLDKTIKTAKKKLLEGQQ